MRYLPDASCVAFAAALYAPSERDCPDPDLRQIVGALVAKHGAVGASNILHALANKVRRKRMRVEELNQLLRSQKNRRGAPPKRDITFLAQLYLDLQPDYPTMSYRAFGRTLAAMKARDNQPAPFKSLEGFAVELGKAVKTLQAKGRNGPATED
nr:hypothetical protein [Roseomonas sp. SXEYE001]